MIDSSEDDGSLGRLVNDSMSNPNIVGRLYDLDRIYYVLLVQTLNQAKRFALTMTACRKKHLT